METETFGNADGVSVQHCPSLLAFLMHPTHSRLQTVTVSDLAIVGAKSHTCRAAKRSRQTRLLQPTGASQYSERTNRFPALTDGEPETAAPFEVCVETGPNIPRQIDCIVKEWRDRACRMASK
jgi:hypothetical protein